MNKEQAHATIKAAAWAVVAQVGWREAIAMLQQTTKEISDTQWSGPGDR